MMKRLAIFGLMMLFLSMVSAVILEPIGDKSVDEGTTLSFLLNATDKNGSIAYHTDFSEGSLSNAGLFTYTPDFDVANLSVKSVPFTAKFWINDTADNTSDSETITITVNNVNRAPVADLTADKTSAKINETVTLDARGSDDPDGDDLTYTFAQVSGPAAVTLDDAGTGRRSFEATEEGTYRFNVTVGDSEAEDADAISITIKDERKLIITDLDVEVGDEDDDNLCEDDGECEPDGYKLEAASPGDTIQFNFEIKNLFTDDEDIEIRDVFVTVTIEDIDDGDDIEEESEEKDIDPNDDDDFTVELDIPLKVDDDGSEYDVIIVVEGEPEEGDDQIITLRYVLEIEKERDDIRIMQASLRSPTVSCSRITELEIEVLNLGRDDQEEVRITAINSELGLDFEADDIELEEGIDDSEYNTDITINAEDVPPGDYPIEISVYHDDDDLDDRATAVLSVEECAEDAPDEEEEDMEEEEEEDEEDVDVIVEPDKDEEDEIPPGQFPVLPVEEEEGFTESTGYIILLTLAGVVLIALIIWIIVLLVKK
ncbi:hypothetical protein GF323_02730 [Candidatus Woesearchaeota archaeon]|nr:hypothetical protein [Candidatus Woesearchaeota archaeon]